MDKLFYIDIGHNLKISYVDLLQKIRLATNYSLYCQKKDTYTTLFNIVLSLLNDSEIYLLDGDFSETELKKLGIDALDIERTVELVFIKPTTVDELVLMIHKASNWYIHLFTSGTTGLPKKITHTLATIARGIKQSDKRADDVWALAYNPTHMAGIQVFFQAISNQNSLVNLFRNDRNTIIHSFKDYSITNISATPTFYRLLQPFDFSLDKVKQVTFGGEKLENNLLDKLKKVFPQARFLNIYASTEAGTLFTADGEFFKIKPELKALIKIVDQEILLHQSLMGQSESLQLNDQWYKTGDLIEYANGSYELFKFLNRKNEMINIGGSKVNPLEVEEILNTHPGVLICRVYGKVNVILGNILLCDLVRKDDNLTEPELRQFLGTRLQDYKIPRIIKFVEELGMTRTGKNIRS